MMLAISLASVRDLIPIPHSLVGVKTVSSHNDEFLIIHISWTNKISNLLIHFIDETDMPSINKKFIIIIP